MRFVASLAIAACAALGSSACAGARGNGTVLGAHDYLAGADTYEDATVAQAPERALLGSGRILTEPLDFDKDGHHYIGGVGRGVVSGTPERVLAAFADPAALGEILPKTKRATLIDGRPEARRIELQQGNSMVDAVYTVEFVPDEGAVAFHLDRTRPHDIADVYGYVKVERFDEKRSLVTLGAAVDVGSGVTEMLFGKRVQDVILSTPYQMRDYFARAGALPDDAVVAQNDHR